MNSLLFQGVLRELENISAKFKEYEIEKAKLLNSCKTYEEYEKKLKQVIDKLNL